MPVIYAKHTSDEDLKIVMERISRFMNATITVHSGDRNYVPTGGSTTSLHLKCRAVDFHPPNLSHAAGFELLKNSMSQIFDLTEAYEVIYHGDHTQTGGKHLHIGRYGEGREGYVDFKTEGLTPATKGHYSRDRKEFTNPKGVKIPKTLVIGTTVDARILSPSIGISHSVGNGGGNVPPDVTLIQSLLNLAHNKLQHSSIIFFLPRKLREDGFCGQFTQQAIKNFQQSVLKFSSPDGRVDPGGRTIHALYLTAYGSTSNIASGTHRIKHSPMTHTKRPHGTAENYGTAAQLFNDSKIRAMLDVLIYSEGTGKFGAGTLCYGTITSAPGHPEWIGKDSRNIKVTDLSKHPNVLVKLNAKLSSTAAGKYQFLFKTWNSLNGVPDFSERSQDIAAIMLMQRRGMIAPLQQGDFASAVYKGAPEWASLPTSGGGSYYPGQSARPLSSLKSVYDQALAKYKQ